MVRSEHRQFHIFQKEIEAVRWMVTESLPLIRGTRGPILVYTDSKTTSAKARFLTSRQFQTAVERTYILFAFLGLHVFHLGAVDNCMADTVSRASEQEVTYEAPRLFGVENLIEWKRGSDAKNAAAVVMPVTRAQSRIAEAASMVPDPNSMEALLIHNRVIQQDQVGALVRKYVRNIDPFPRQAFSPEFRSALKAECAGEILGEHDVFEDGFIF